MKSKITLFLIAIMAVGTLLFVPREKESEIDKLREKHSEFLRNHPYNETLKLNKNERKNLGIPPNKYFEEQALLEMNPATGRTEYEKKFALQEQLLKNSFQKNVPGTNTNAWVERGPSDVPGRTRAILFDPNDATNKRVFAGGVSGGLWVNDDITSASSPWTRVNIPENLAISSIAADPNNSNIFYLGTGESYVGGQVNGNGIWRSTNGGTSWTNVLGGTTGAQFFNGGSTVTVNSPGSIAGELIAIRAGFGPAFGPPITGNLVLVDDGTGATSTEGCNALINGAAVSGNIAVIQRGSCNFTVKVKNAQDQGAVAVIMVNNIPGNPFSMGGTDATITIPSLMVSQDDGETIISTLSTEAVNATLEDTAAGLPFGLPVVPGIFLINDIVTRDVGSTTEIYAAVADAGYGEAPGTTLGGTDIGLYRSTNGTTWAKVSLPTTASGNPYEPNDIEIASDNTIWMSTSASSSFGDGGGTIFSSSNGTSFTEEHVVPNASRTEIEISASDPDKIYVLAQENPVTIIRTIDGFASTETLALPNDADNGIPANDFTRGQAFYDLMLEVDPTDDEIVYVGGIDIHRSADGGTSWTQISKWSNNPNLNTLTVPLVHADIHCLAFDPSDTDKAIIGTDGGVFYANSLAAASGSASAIFSSNNGYNTTQYYWGAIGQTTGTELLLAGAQDNGSSFFEGAVAGINGSQEIQGGDGAYCFIDKDENYLIVSLPFNSFTRFDAAQNFNLPRQIVSNGNEGDFINPAELDDNLEVLYTNAFGASNIISSFVNVHTNSFTRRNLSDPLLTTGPTAFKVSPYTTASSTLLVGTRTGNLLKVENANTATQTWTDITGSGFVGSISAINFGANENEILVTFHNYGVNNIWFTDDGGTTWQNKEGNFPDIPVKAVMMNPLLNDEVIIGTDLGVWRTANFKGGSPTWVQSQNGMQNVKVTSFDLRTVDNTVLASTYGRGVFTGQFTDVVLSVDDISSIEDELSVFPNPSNGRVNLKSINDLGPAKIVVYDLNGREVFAKNENISGTLNLNLANLSKGLYVLQVHGENYKLDKKIVIE